MADVVDPAIFEKLEEYFFCDAFTESFEAWAKPHAELFGPEASMESEQKLEHMQVYKEFTAMYEEKLEAFVASQGLSMMPFMRACAVELQKGQDSDDWSARSPYGFILRVIQATSEYDMFLQMMAEVAQKVADEQGP